MCHAHTTTLLAPTLPFLDTPYVTHSPEITNTPPEHISHEQSEPESMDISEYSDLESNMEMDFISQEAMEDDNMTSFPRSELPEFCSGAGVPQVCEVYFSNKILWYLN